MATSKLAEDETNVTTSQQEASLHHTHLQDYVVRPKCSH